MKRKLISILASVSLLLAIMPGAVQADSRCGGFRGIQVWQDSNKGGPSVTFCGSIYVSDLSQVTTNLSFFANWNNRISSYETFNQTQLQAYRLFERTNYQLNQNSPSGFHVTTYGNDYVPFTGVYWSNSYPGGLNDSISSLRTYP